MKFIVSVASMDQSKLDGFLKQVENTRGMWPQDLRILVLGTGGNVKINMNTWGMPITFRPLSEKQRYYGEVMAEKIQMTKHLIDEDGIFFNIDDDYALNPYVFKFAERIMNDNPQVNYMSLLRGPGVTPPQTEELSGVPFMRLGSCMGGCLIARWPVFGSMVQDFFTEYPLENMFDQDFFSFLQRKTGDGQQVYTPVHFSLVQHCDLVSHYNKPRGEMMRAENFDPRMNPFVWVTK